MELGITDDVYMRKALCETYVWKVLPCIRRELAVSLTKYGLSQKEIAGKIGVTRAAVSQYFSDKRGCYVSFSEVMREEIDISVKKIYEGGDVIGEICRLCCIAKGSL